MSGKNTQYKLFMIFFLRFLGVFVPVPINGKVILFGFSTGTKSEKLNFYSSNILNSSLVPVLNPQDLKKSMQKFKKWYLYRFKYLIFVPKKFLKNFGGVFGTWYYLLGVAH